MAAIAQVKVLSTDRTQPFAIGFAKRVDREFKQGILADERLEINVRVFGDDQARITDGFFIERIQLGHAPINGLAERLETARALEDCFACEFSCHQ